MTGHCEERVHAGGHDRRYVRRRRHLHLPVVRHHVCQVVEGAECDEVDHLAEYLAHHLQEQVVADAWHGLAIQEAGEPGYRVRERVADRNAFALHVHPVSAGGDMRDVNEVALGDVLRRRAGAFPVLDVVVGRVGLHVRGETGGDLKLLLGAHDAGDVGGEDEHGHGKRCDDGELEHHGRACTPHPPLQPSQYVFFALHLPFLGPQWYTIASTM